MAYVVIFDHGTDGALVPIMATSHAEIVGVIQRLVSRELFQAAYAKHPKPDGARRRQPKRRRVPHADE
jgi:hypothetical protein